MRADEAMRAVLEHDLGKDEVRAKFDCVVGLRDAAVSVGEGENRRAPVRHDQDP